MAFDKLKKVFGGSPSESEYIEIDLGREAKKAKVIVRPFVLASFEDITPILNVLREGYTIAIIDIKPLRTRDIIELKRAISKLKKTVDALEGSIAGFGENTIIVTPAFAELHKGGQPVQSQPDERQKPADY
jgi:SepF-like predicted cell division protein (DUF552 family)